MLFCGRPIPVDAPVVVWTEPPYFDAHRARPRFDPTAAAGTEPRYRMERKIEDALLAARLEDVATTTPGGTAAAELLAEAVELVVLHYDACGNSRACFRVLHDERGLSCHFLLDLDGTIYQTLDLRHQAWHARQANPRSIGIEIAHVGAAGDEGRLERQYERDAKGLRQRLSADASLRIADFVARPARGGDVPLAGEIHGESLVQYDFTAEQYASLEALVAALVEAFPRLELRIPRAADGSVRHDVLSDEELRAFRGVIGHYHVTEQKVDPGPAFDWEGFLARSQARLTQARLTQEAGRRP